MKIIFALLLTLIYSFSYCQDYRNQALRIIDSVYTNNEKTNFYLTWDSILKINIQEGFIGLTSRKFEFDSIYNNQKFKYIKSFDFNVKDSVLIETKVQKLKQKHCCYNVIFVDNPLEAWNNSNSVFCKSNELNFYVESFSFESNGKILTKRELLCIKIIDNKLYFVSKKLLGSVSN